MTILVDLMIEINEIQREQNHKFARLFKAHSKTMEYQIDEADRLERVVFLQMSKDDFFLNG